MAGTLGAKRLVRVGGEAVAGKSQADKGRQARGPCPRSRACLGSTYIGARLRHAMAYFTSEQADWSGDLWIEACQVELIGTRKEHG